MTTTHRAGLEVRRSEPTGSWYHSFAVAASSRYWAATARILLGFIFLWAFLDKNFGWEYSTASGQGWAFGTGDGDPTYGFLNFGVNPSGPMADFFTEMSADSPSPTHWVNWLFMAGLLGIGVALMLGIFVRIGAISGAVLLLLMYLAVAPWANNIDPDTGAGSSSNPLIDEHIIYVVVLILVMLFERGRTWGLGRMWQSTSLVQKAPWLA